MSGSNDILLSLCIPTFNRADTLAVVLERLVADPDFDEEVEIVVSDNCSPDHTETVVRGMAARYPNVKYFRNEQNVKDKNFYLALSRGRGTYLKLLNDYIYFKPGGLKRMKEAVRKHCGEDANLFFYSNLRRPHHISKEVTVQTPDEFVRLINNKVTWITNFGIWSSRLRSLDCSDILWNTQLAQMVWTLNEVALRKTVIVNYHSYVSMLIPDKKITYEFFVPHVVNYYKVYGYYMDRGMITEKTIRYDKYRILSHFVGSKIIQFFYYGVEASFDLNAARKIVDEYFGDIPYYRYLKIKGTFLGILYKTGILPFLKDTRESLRKWFGRREKRR